MSEKKGQRLHMTRILEKKTLVGGLIINLSKF